MSKSKKSTRRNTGGRRTVTPPPYSAGPAVADLERGMEATELAMKVAARLIRPSWI